MENLTKVEKIREKCNVTYDEAKDALRACDGDVLDAIIYLEKLGKVRNVTAHYNTSDVAVSREFEDAQRDYERSVGNKQGFGKKCENFFDWCRKLIKKGCDTTFYVSRNDEKLVAVPVIVLVVCIVFAFWVTLPLLVVGLFMDCKYKFIGLDTKFDLNEMMDKASDKAEEIKSDFRSEDKE